MKVIDLIDTLRVEERALIDLNNQYIETFYKAEEIKSAWKLMIWGNKNFLQEFCDQFDFFGLATQLSNDTTREACLKTVLSQDGTYQEFNQKCIGITSAIRGCEVDITYTKFLIEYAIKQGMTEIDYIV
jgi:hypothetical protein